MAERDLTCFVADVHLGLDVKDPERREKRFIDFLRSIPAERTETLYLLGDIWDFWFEYRDVVPKEGTMVLKALMELMDKGVKVKFFPGNHDLWCFSYFEELGMQKLSQPFVTEIGGKTFCLGHGDGLGPGDTGYKIIKKLFCAKWLQKLFAGLPPSWAYSLGRKWSKSSRLAKNLREDFRGHDEPLYKFAASYPGKVDYFIFGHRHCDVDLKLPSGARLIILNDWIDGDSYRYFSGIFGLGGSSQKIEK